MVDVKKYSPVTFTWEYIMEIAKEAGQLRKSGSEAEANALIKTLEEQIRIAQNIIVPVLYF